MISLKNHFSSWKIKFYYENGQIIGRGVFKNDLINGDFQEYYESGELESKGFYKNGNREGLFEEYFKNGTVKFKYLWEYIENEKYKIGGKLFIPKIVKIIKT